MGSQRAHPSRRLTGLIIAGAVGGVFAGWFIGAPMASWSWVGEFFLGCLKMIIVPLVVSSMIVGIGALGDVRRIGRTGAWTLGYYIATTAASVSIGVALVVWIQPGVGAGIAGVEIPERVRSQDVYHFSDFVLSFIWPNIADAMAKMKLLPIIVFSLLFGAIATTIGEKGRMLCGFFGAVNDVIMKMVGLIMWIAPIGIFALIASSLGKAGGAEGVFRMFQTLGLYALTVILGLLLHAGLVLPLLLHFLGRRSVLSYFVGLSDALVSAFSTASSSATLPITLKCLKEKNKVRKEAADFVSPLGATINMDGTALYEAVAAIFIAQAWGVDLSGFSLVLVFLMATLASIGAAGIPEAGLVTLVLVLQAVGLPLEGIGLILAIDWILDRFRTTVNVWGDSVGAAVVEQQVFKESPVARS